MVVVVKIAVMVVEVTVATAAATTTATEVVHCRYLFLQQGASEPLALNCTDLLAILLHRAFVRVLCELLEEQLGGLGG